MLNMVCHGLRIKHAHAASVSRSCLRKIVDAGLLEDQQRMLIKEILIKARINVRSHMKMIIRAIGCRSLCQVGQNDFSTVQMIPLNRLKFCSRAPDQPDVILILNQLDITERPDNIREKAGICLFYEEENHVVVGRWIISAGNSGDPFDHCVVAWYRCIRSLIPILDGLCPLFSCKKRRAGKCSSLFGKSAIQQPLTPPTRRRGSGDSR